MRRNMLNEQFHHPEYADLKFFLLLKEWFTTVGQLILHKACHDKEKVRCLQA